MTPPTDATATGLKEARIAMIGTLIERLEDRRTIRWNAPDKDGVINQLVDRQYLIDAIICLDAYRQSLALLPSASVEPDGWLAVKVNGEGGIVMPYGPLHPHPDAPNDPRYKWAPFYLGEPQ